MRSIIRLSLQIEMHLVSSGEQCVEVSTLNEKDISIKVNQYLPKLVENSREKVLKNF